MTNFISRTPNAMRPYGPERNIDQVKADSVWAEGYTGQGIVVGTIDSGVEYNHPAFGGRWRSTDGWYDPYNDSTLPYDDQGHGTHAMGSICGGDGPGPYPDDIGVAPGATFIAAKGFSSDGIASPKRFSSALTGLPAPASPTFSPTPGARPSATTPLGSPTARISATWASSLCSELATTLRPPARIRRAASRFASAPGR